MTAAGPPSGRSAIGTTVREDGISDTVVVRSNVPSGEVTATVSGTFAAQLAGIRATSASALAAVRPLPSSAQAALPSSIVAAGEVSVPVTPGRSVRPAEYTGADTSMRSPDSKRPSLSPTGYGSLTTGFWT